MMCDMRSLHTQEFSTVYVKRDLLRTVKRYKSPLGDNILRLRISVCTVAFFKSISVDKKDSKSTYVKMAKCLNLLRGR